jgi:hypothetical protein
MRWCGAFLMVMAAACGNRDADRPIADPPVEPPPVPAIGPATPSIGPTDTPPVPSPEPAQHPPAAPDQVALRGTPGGGLIAIDLTNLGNADVRLRPALTVERQNGSTWAEVETAGLTLRWDCQAPPPPFCMSLAPGASIQPPPWLGTTGDAQCICTRCGPVPAGTYRFVATNCDGTRLEGTPFTISR